MATPIKRPMVRKVATVGNRTTLVATLTDEGVMLRPLRARRPEAAIALTWQQVYRCGLMARPPKRKRRKVKRGAL